MVSRRFVRSTLIALALAGSVACSSAGSESDGQGASGAPASGGAIGMATAGGVGIGGQVTSAGAGAGAAGQSGANTAGGASTINGASGAGPGGTAGRGATGGADGINNGGAGGNGGSIASGGSASQGGNAAGGSSGSSGSGSTTALGSDGCGKTPTLKNNGYNAITSSGKSRQYYLRWPPSYDQSHPYRLIVDFHGAGGKGTDVAPGFFGLYDLSNGSTIFIAPDASGGIWSAATDTTLVDDILKAVEANLCIDVSRVELEGFSQGAAMVWTLSCSRPNVFKAVVGHSGGGLANPTSCQPVPYLGSLGLSDISGNSQKTQTDQFAKWNGCTIETLPTAPTGGHVCTNYKGCPSADPVRWCSYDGGHTPSPSDAGKSSSWMPGEVWPFLQQF